MVEEMKEQRRLHSLGVTQEEAGLAFREFSRTVGQPVCRADSTVLP